MDSISQEINSLKELKEIDNWLYTEEYFDKRYPYNKCKITSLLGDKNAREIKFFIIYIASELPPNLRFLNRFVKLLKSGELDKFDTPDEILNFLRRFNNFPNSFLNNFESHMDHLYSHNYEKAPAQIVKIIELVKNNCQTALTMRNKIQSIVDKYYKSKLEHIRNEEEKLENEIAENQKLAERERYEKEVEERLNFLKKIGYEDGIPGKWDLVELKNSKILEGIVYVLTNDLMPGVVKIGFTAGNPERRARVLSEKYSLPSRFIVADYVRTKDPYIVEQRVHSALKDHFVSGEFFKCSLEQAMSLIYKYAI